MISQNGEKKKHFEEETGSPKTFVPCFAINFTIKTLLGRARNPRCFKKRSSVCKFWYCEIVISRHRKNRYQPQLSKIWNQGKASKPKTMAEDGEFNPFFDDSGDAPTEEASNPFADDANTFFVEDGSEPISKPTIQVAREKKLLFRHHISIFLSIDFSYLAIATVTFFVFLPECTNKHYQSNRKKSKCALSMLSYNSQNNRIQALFCLTLTN